MLYTLVVTKGPDEGLSYAIRTTRVSVGRAADMTVILTDPEVRPRHFVVTFEEGGWKAITYEPDATILIDRRWEHPTTRQRGARIFLGSSQLLLVAGDVDLNTAKAVSEGLDVDTDEETLRESLTKVGNETYQFSHDMRGKAARVNEPKQRGGRPAKPPDAAQQKRTSIPTTERLPDGVLNPAGSQMFQGKAGMMPQPKVAEGKKSEPPKTSTAGRGSWSPPRDNTGVPNSRALVKGQMISLTDTAIGAMPSSSRDLWVLYDKDGPFAAELRILATRMEELKSTFGYKTFLITSVNEGDGKTVTASNLALVMSEDPERKIALVDANFRGPRAAELFNLDKNRGLLAAISGQRALSECVARVLGRNLIVLHAGGEHKNPSAVLSDPRFKTLLAELTQAVDFMIIDAPSAIGHADVPLLAQHADAVFMVVAAHKTERAKLDKALDTIGKSRVVGSIFVDYPEKQG